MTSNAPATIAQAHDAYTRTYNTLCARWPELSTNPDFNSNLAQASHILNTMSLPGGKTNARMLEFHIALTAANTYL